MHTHINGVGRVAGCTICISLLYCRNINHRPRSPPRPDGPTKPIWPNSSSKRLTGVFAIAVVDASRRLTFRCSKSWLTSNSMPFLSSSDNRS